MWTIFLNKLFPEKVCLWLFQCWHRISITYGYFHTIPFFRKQEVYFKKILGRTKTGSFAYPLSFFIKHGNRIIRIMIMIIFWNIEIVCICLHMRCILNKTKCKNWSWSFKSKGEVNKKYKQNNLLLLNFLFSVQYYYRHVILYFYH
jgi:hypothetical protein